jgi:hypothetical protein
MSRAASIAAASVRYLTFVEQMLSLVRMDC